MTNELIKEIQKIALESYRMSYPPKYYTGIVETIYNEIEQTELSIRLLEENMLITQAFLYLTESVIDSIESKTYDDQYYTDSSGKPEHTHMLSKNTVYNFRSYKGLKIGEKVLLVRIQNGEKFVVLSRLYDGNHRL